jgi:phage FluMu protein gp41
MAKKRSHSQKRANARKAPRRKTQKKESGFASGRLKGKIQILGDIVSPITLSKIGKLCETDGGRLRANAQS